MNHKNTESLLREVQSGALSVEDALVKLKSEPFEDLGFAKIDHHRALRQGAAEVVYGAGKTPEQIAGIVDSLQPAPYLKLREEYLANDVVSMIIIAAGGEPDPEFKDAYADGAAEMLRVRERLKSARRP